MMSLHALLFACAQSSAEIIIHDATDITQTKATLSADFPDLSIAHGFQYKKGTVPEIDQFSKAALSSNSDPVQISSTGNYAWTAKASKGWVESNPNVPEDQVSEMSMNVNLSSSTAINFEWSVDSEDEIGFLSFLVDGNTMASITGYVDFTNESHIIPEGEHTLSWQYSKSAPCNVGADKGMVRNIRIINTTQGEWTNANVTDSSLTIDSLDFGQEYIFRATSSERRNHSIAVSWSGIKSFKTLDIIPSKIEDIATTQSTAMAEIKQGEFGDAGIKNYLEATAVGKKSIVNVMDYAVPPTCIKTDIPERYITVDGTIILNLSRFDYKTISIDFYLKEDGKIEFEHRYSGGYLYVYDNEKKLGLLERKDWYDIYKNFSANLPAGYMK